MHARRLILRAFGCMGLCLAITLAGCGDEEPAAPESGDAAWSDPAGTTATGSPDGDAADGTTSAAVLLEQVRARIAEGSGHADPSFERAVGDLASVLWPQDAAAGTLEAARVHMQVSNIAGEVGRWLAASPEARAERTKSDPTDIALHDALLAAAVEGPEAYRDWCGGEGARLLKEHADAQYRKHFPPR